ncbi:peptidylprolyl isomerase [Brevibacillus humidisoli]|uniref:peptidylprolyl isomerase n=1 Tax=Brevibacillus humidisoli TaxID=2895522 RepID=UPI001E5F34FB|nr:peptidylprolyl isomerase [Brevibacillus humidisoli]UFJ40541.1 peptidylprolyl isomerase [Brevibacillus humidisoli]
MQKTDRRKARFFPMMTAILLAFAVLAAGCGKEEAEQPAKPNEQAEQNDQLAQFPGVTLPYEQVGPDTVVAEYEGGKLTAKQFEDFLRTLNFLQPGQGQAIKNADQQMLETYIREYTGTILLANRADEKVAGEAKKQAEQTFDRFKQEYMGLLNNEEANFDKLMDKQGVTKDVVIEQMTLINSSISYLRSGISEEELKQRYDKADKSAFTTASVRHILISNESRSDEEAKKLADDLAKRLKAGEDFAALAKEYSDDPGSKETGGLYENANVNDWVPEFKEAALTLPIGEISDPVKTSYGYHVMKVEKRAVTPFEEAKDALRETALQEKYNQFIKDEVDKLVTKWNYLKVTQKS